VVRKRAGQASAAPAPPAIPIPAGPVNPYIVACAWRGVDGPCLLPGAIGRGRHEGDAAYCGWHAQFVIIGRDYALMPERAEFDRWVTTRYRPYPYCCVWTHHDADDLWLAVQGIRELGPARPCARADCRRGHQSEVPF